MITYTLELSPQMVGVIGEALAAQPYKIVAPVLEVLQKQVTEQDAKRNASNGGIKFEDIHKDANGGMKDAAN